MLKFISLVVALATAFAPARAQQPKIDELRMVTYQAVFVVKGPKWTPEIRPPAEPAARLPEVTALVRAHREYISSLMRSRRAHIAGPFAGDSNLRGVYIVSGTPEEAKAIGEADPGVKAGRYAIEVIGWMGPEGWFQTPADVADTEEIYFGFLLTGEKTQTISPEETQTLMRGHLDYMDGQAKQGKLVMAGPLVNAAPRRGLIVYRVPTVAEAIERASADPMVKAGRMKPEFYEWTVPRGILR